jgi:hypothetical protein
MLWTMLPHISLEWLTIAKSTSAKMVSDEGFEPRFPGPKRRMIPFHHTLKLTIGAPWETRTPTPFGAGT